MLKDLINLLTEKEKMVLCGHALNLRWSEIARELNISRERVRQIKETINEKLGGSLENNKPSRAEGYVKVVSTEPSIILALCNHNNDTIQEIKPYDRVKIIARDSIPDDPLEKRAKRMTRLKKARELADALPVGAWRA